MGRPVAYRGSRFTIVYAVRLNQTSPGEEFYDALGDTDKAKLNKLFEVLGDHGKIVNEEKFKRIDDTKFFEFKSFQIRLPCFFAPGGLVVITHGFSKKKDKTPKSEIARAEMIKKEDEERERDES